MLKTTFKFPVIILLIISDIFAFYISLIIAFYVRLVAGKCSHLFPYFNQTLFHYFTLWWLIVTFIISNFYHRLYTKRYIFWEQVREIIKSNTVAFFVILTIVSIGKMSGIISRAVLTITYLLSLIISPLIKFFVELVMYKSGMWKANAIIIGAGNAGRCLDDGLKREWHLGYNIIGFLDDDENKKNTIVNDKKVLGTIAEIDKIVLTNNVQTVFVAITNIEPQYLSNLVTKVQRIVKEVYLVPNIKGIPLMDTELHYLFYQELLMLQIKNNLMNPLNRFFKRVFDLTLTILILPFFIPIFIVIALIIKLDSDGPVLYMHKRIGKDRKDLKVYKFRTMYTDADTRLKHILETDHKAQTEWQLYFKLRDDPRITRVGKFLRKTSLDETPQLINVLIGNMSLVGPRPVVAEELDLYYKDYAGYYLSILPGVTGLWQVSGRNNTNYDYRVKLDLWYVMNWSLWFDIMILIKTIRVIIKGEGAY